MATLREAARGCKRDRKKAGMERAIRAGFGYFLAVFAIGFVLGTLRTLLIAPRLGPLAAVALEIPVMLGLAWLICGRLLRRHAVTGVGPRLAMGGLAFTLLMIGEMGISVLLAGRTMAEHWALYRQLPDRIGLAAQLLFAAFPLFHGRNRR
jgi:hypothetical protein